MTLDRRLPTSCPATPDPRSARRARRLAAGGVLLAALGMAVAAPAGANDFPTRPITIIVGFPAGGGGDITIRQFAERFRARIGQPIVVENRPGASGNIGLQAGARAAPDGYTLTALFAASAVNPHVMKGSIVDPSKEFEPVAAISSYYLTVVAHPSAPHRSLADLVEATRRQPGTVSYASLGGSVLLAQLMLEQAAGIKFLSVPYKGTADQLRAVLGGETVASGIPIKAALPHIKEGKLRSLGYFGPKRTAQLPDVPTIMEIVPGATPTGLWTGLAAPLNTPRDVVGRLSKAVQDVLQDRAFRDRLIENGDEPLSGTAEEMGQILRRDIKLFGELIRKAGMSPQ